MARKEREKEKERGRGRGGINGNHDYWTIYRMI